MWIALLWILNFIDAASTMIALETGHFREVNPLMNYLYSIDKWLFFFFKIVTVSTICFMFKKMIDRKFTQYVVYSLTGLYSILICWHVYSWFIYYKR